MLFSFWIFICSLERLRCLPRYGTRSLGDSPGNCHRLFLPLSLLDSASAPNSTTNVAHIPSELSPFGSVETTMPLHSGYHSASQRKYVPPLSLLSTWTGPSVAFQSTRFVEDWI